jgi:hypothetical protein
VTVTDRRRFNIEYGSTISDDTLLLPEFVIIKTGAGADSVM